MLIVLILLVLINEKQPKLPSIESKLNKLDTAKYWNNFQIIEFGAFICVDIKTSKRVKLQNE